MSRDPAKDVLKNPVDLPQIRLPIRGTKNADELAAERDDIEKLTKIVEDAFAAIGDATGLSEQAVLHLIEGVHVEMLKDVLKDGIDMDALKNGIQEAIKTIALAIDLDTEQISDIFTAKRNTNIKDIVARLHERSQANRARFGA